MYKIQYYWNTRSDPYWI